MIRTRIRHWEQLRAIYMPGLLQYHQDLEALNPPSPDEPRIQPEDTKLWLPSSIPADRRDGACVPGLARIEEKLRTAQCRDALEGIRHVLRVKSRMILFKNKNVRGQTHSTRSRSVIDRVHNRAKGHAEKYRFARVTKLALSGPGEWEDTLRPLLDQDVRSYSDPDKLRHGPGRRGTVEDEDSDGHGEQNRPPNTELPPAGGEGISLLPEVRSRRDGTGDTRRTLSWIWTTDTAVDRADSDDILRAEWAKSRARAARATEEVLLLREEMRRTMVFLEWKANWWRDRVELTSCADSALAEGIRGYAHEQAGIQDQLRAHFRGLWQGPLRDEEDVAAVAPGGTSTPTDLSAIEGIQQTNPRPASFEAPPNDNANVAPSASASASAPTAAPATADVNENDDEDGDDDDDDNSDYEDDDDDSDGEDGSDDEELLGDVGDEEHDNGEEGEDDNDDDDDEDT